MIYSLFAVLNSCEKKVNSPKIEFIDGVKIIHNSSEPTQISKSIVFGEELIIGGEDESGDVHLFRPWTFRVDKNHNVYIHDFGDQTIKVYDDRGIFKQTIGRQGSGPGEFLESIPYKKEDLAAIKLRI